MLISSSSSVMKGMAIIILIYCGLKYLSIAMKRKNSEEKIIMRGFAVYFFGIALSELFWYFLLYQLDLIYIDGILYGNRGMDYINAGFIFLERLGQISLISGQAFFIYSFERIVKKSKYLMTLYNVIIIVLFLLFLPYDINQLIYSVSYMINIFIFIIIVISFTKWSREEFKAISIMIVIGLLIINIGTGFEEPNILTLNLVPLFLNPLLVMIGCAICLTPTILTPESFSNAIKYWYSLGYAIFFIVITTTVFTLIFLPPSIIFFYLIFDIFIILFLVTFRRDISPKNKEKTKIPSKIKPKQVTNFLELFTKPESFTEEEVQYHKEKKICIVCKGKSLRFTYICPECNAIYCENCARTLSNIENACWVCKTPFDKKKPIKPYDETIEEMQQGIIKKEIKRKKTKMQ